MPINCSDSQSRYSHPTHLYSAQAPSLKKQSKQQPTHQDLLVSLNQRDKLLREQMAKHSFKPPNQKLLIAVQVAKYLFFTVALPLTLLTVTLPRYIAVHLLPVVHRQFSKKIETIFKPAATVMLQLYNQFLRFAKRTELSLKKVIKTAASPFVLMWNRFKGLFNLKTWFNSSHHPLSSLLSLPAKLAQAAKQLKRQIEEKLIEPPKRWVQLCRQKSLALLHFVQTKLRLQWQAVTGSFFSGFQKVKESAKKTIKRIALFRQKTKTAIQSMQTSITAFFARLKAVALRSKGFFANFDKRLAEWQEKAVKGLKKRLETLKQAVTEHALFQRIAGAYNKLAAQIGYLIENLKASYKNASERAMKTCKELKNGAKQLLKKLASLPSSYFTRLLKRVLPQNRYEQLSTLQKKMRLYVKQIGQSAGERQKQLFNRTKKRYLKAKKAIMRPVEFALFKAKRALLWTKLISMWFAIVIGFWTLALQRLSRSYVE